MKIAHKKQKKYSDILLEPIKWSPDLALGSEPEKNATFLDGMSDEEREFIYQYRYKKAADEVIAARSIRVAALFNHYEINPEEEDACRKLVLALAEAHVPGFKMESSNKRGRKQKWKLDELLMLYFRVHELGEWGMKPFAACKKLAAEQTEREMPRAPITERRKRIKQIAKTFHGRWLEAKKSKIVQFFNALPPSEAEKWRAEIAASLQAPEAQK